MESKREGWLQLLQKAFEFDLSGEYTMSSLDQALQAITESLDSTLESVEKLHSKTDSPELPVLVQDLLDKTSQELPEGVSLLDLKNNAMLSYLNNVLLVVLARVEAAKTNKNVAKINEGKDEAIKRSIVQRVVMERGIKNLEKKLQYQLEKMIRNYSKMDNESSEQAAAKKLQSSGQREEDGEEDQVSEEDNEEDSEDELNYKPDTSALMKSVKAASSSRAKASGSGSGKDSGSSATTEKYKPPKIAAALPPQQLRDSSGRPARNGKKLQAMEEYLAETGEAPMSEQSIGSNILNGGRGGVQTAHERRKEQEIKSFEESNFTRLNTNLSKTDKRNKRRQDQETFFGEDWGIFNGKSGDMNTKRAKPKSAWDRAKRRRT
jgi:U3 small nucleolar ribonucleoprotein protein LCP5